MNPSRGSGNLALAAAAVGFAIAAFGLGVYQAWWTLAFAVGGLAIAWADIRGSASAPAIVGGLAIAAILALGFLGVFLVVMSPFAGRRPDLPPGGGVPILLLGFGALAVASLALAVTIRYMRRAIKRSTDSEQGADPDPSDDIPAR